MLFLCACCGEKKPCSTVQSLRGLKVQSLRAPARLVGSSFTAQKYKFSLYGNSPSLSDDYLLIVSCRLLAANC